MSMLLIMLIMGNIIYSLSPECEQPDELVVAFTQLECAKNLNIDVLKEKACKAIYNSAICEFQNDDLPVIKSIAEGMINKCAKTKLVDQNLCVDKYKGI